MTDLERILAVPCVWCGQPTTMRLDALFNGDGPRADRDGEPWHRACFAERQAWLFAVTASNYDPKDREELGISRAAAEIGHLWLGLAARFDVLRGGGDQT